MTWDEVMDAFKRQIPVVFNSMGVSGQILCSRICEVGIRAERDGTFHKFANGMDRNENCVYHGTPDMFRLPEAEGGDAE